ncbi:hypothetical protein QFZ77_007616 [Paenibacillus sp. V4I3]|nr:hypothetical protein [Paenibacillus sp. V4I3]
MNNGVKLERNNILQILSEIDVVITSYKLVSIDTFLYSFAKIPYINIG